MFFRKASPRTEGRRDAHHFYRFTPNPPEGNFYRFMSISGWSLLPIYRLRNRNFSTGALRAPPGKPPQHNTPPPHPRLGPGAPAPTFASIASRAPITRRFPPRRGRRRRPALRHPARSLGLRARGLARAWRVATFTILHRFCRILHFYHFTAKSGQLLPYPDPMPRRKRKRRAALA